MNPLYTQRDNLKQNVLVIAIVVVSLIALASIFGYLPTLSTQQASTITLFPTGTTTSSAQNGMVSVSRKVVFTLNDKYGQAVIASKVLTIYRDNGAGQAPTFYESLTTGSDGSVTSTKNYYTGDVYWIKAVQTASTTMMWFQWQVPAMALLDAQGTTATHSCQLYMFTYVAPTLTVQDSAGNAYSDNGKYNYTLRGTTPIFTVTWHEGTDNKGYMASYDPVNKIDWKALLVLKVSGTNYEMVGITGFDGQTNDAIGRGQISKGSANYYCAEINPESISKYKPGSSYTLNGAGAIVINVDLSGYSGTAGKLDFYVYFYASWDNFVSKGSFGGDALSVISGAPYTIQLDNT